MGKHTQLGRVWETGKFQNSSDCCKPIFSIPFSCHFSSLIFAVPGQCPVLKRPFHLMQNHPKTPQEAPEELSVSEASAVLTFRHRVEIAKKKKWFGFQSMLRGLQALWWKPTKLSHWHFLGMFCCSALLLYPPDLSESYCSCLHCLLWHNLTACKGPTKISVLLSAQITAALPLDTAPELLYSHSLQTLPLGTAVLK